MTRRGARTLDHHRVQTIDVDADADRTQDAGDRARACLLHAREARQSVRLQAGCRCASEVCCSGSSGRIGWWFVPNGIQSLPVISFTRTFRAA